MDRGGAAGAGVGRDVHLARPVEVDGRLQDVGVRRNVLHRSPGERGRGADRRASDEGIGGPRNFTGIRGVRQRAEMRRAVRQVGIVVVDDETQPHGVGNVGRIGRRRAEHQPRRDGIGFVVREGLLELLDQLPCEAGIGPADHMRIRTRRGPEDHVACRPQTGCLGREVAANAGLTRRQNRHRIAEALAIAAVYDTALRGIDAMTVFMHHHVGIGGVGTAAARLEKVKRRPVPKCVAVLVDVGQHRQVRKIARLEDAVGEIARNLSSRRRRSAPVDPRLPHPD